MNNDKNFTKKIRWDLGHRLLKLDQKHDKNGNLYLVGDFGYNCKVTIRPMLGDFNKGKWEMQIYPIEFTKVEQPIQRQQTFPQHPKQQDIVVEAKNLFNAQEVSGDEVPF